jgi:hypothetical protein
MPPNWILVAYQAPSQPSTARVSAWRALHRLGGLYLGPTVCLLPTRLADSDALDAVGRRIRAAGGSIDLLEVETFAPSAEARLRERYNEARAAEYAEIVERAEAIVTELEREAFRDKFTFAEVEENEADLTRIRQWLRRVATRDLFGCDMRSAAEAALRDATERLTTFADEAMTRETGGHAIGTAGSDDRPLRIVRGGD